jgi:hypothetical protein
MDTTKIPDFPESRLSENIKDSSDKTNLIAQTQYGPLAPPVTTVSAPSSESWASLLHLGVGSSFILRGRSPRLRPLHDERPPSFSPGSHIRSLAVCHRHFILLLKDSVDAHHLQPT